MVAITSSIDPTNFWHHDYICPDVSCLIVCLHALLNFSASSRQLFMSYRLHKTIFLLCVSLLVSYTTYLTCYYVAEKYFFDKFFYYKSFSHGYFPPSGLKFEYSQYGDRGKYIGAISDMSPNVLGATTKADEYKIAIFGDSLVWGQGIRNNQRFAKLLEDRLDSIRPTRVYSFGHSGDNVFDNYQKFKLAEEKFGRMDLYIFAFYNNDLVFNDDSRYFTRSFVEKDLLPGCSGEVVYDPPLDSLGDDGSPLYTAKINSTNASSANYCAYKKLVQLYPRENTMYVDLGSIEGKDEAQVKFSSVIEQDFDTISFDPIDIKIAHVSRQDGHPSAYVNRIYSDTLFQKISQNEMYHFSK